MWNPFKRAQTPEELSVTIQNRLRSLEQTVDDVAADVTLACERLVKLEARIRARARRALQATAADPEDTDDGGGSGDVGIIPGAHAAPPAGGSELSPSITKEEVRARARSRGWGGRAS